MHRDCLYKGQGPHEGKRLAHMAEHSRYCCMPNGFTTGCNSTVMHSSGNNLEEIDWVGDVVKGRVLTEGATEAGPNVPGFIAPSVVLSSDSGAGRCLCLADISEECMFGLSWHNCQG